MVVVQLYQVHMKTGETTCSFQTYFNVVNVSQLFWKKSRFTKIEKFEKVCYEA